MYVIGGVTALAGLLAILGIIFISLKKKNLVTKEKDEISPGNQNYLYALSVFIAIKH